MPPDPATALARLEEGDVETAVDVLLECWRARRQPEVATALEALSARLSRPAVAGRTLKERHATWLALAAGGDPADVPRLLDMLLEGTSATDAQARIEALDKCGPDPRLARALVDVVKAQRHFVSKPKFWRALLVALHATGDVRLLAELRAATPEGEVVNRPAGYGGFQVFSLRDRLIEQLPRIARRLENLTPTPLTDEDRGILTRLGARATLARSETDLLAAIHAAPDDDAPRLVYADALLERGDTRGELITLQIRRARGDGKVARSQARREKELLAQHRKALLGDLAPVAYWPEFARGFLVSAAAVFEPESLRPLIAHPLWRTVETLHTDEVSLILRRDLLALRHLYLASGLEQLLAEEATLPRVESVHVPLHTLASAIDLSRLDATFPVTRRLIVRRVESSAAVAEQLAPILASTWGGRLDDVTIQGFDDCPLELSQWRSAPHRPPLVRFELPSLTAAFDGTTLTVERCGKGTLEFLPSQLSNLDERPRVVVLKAWRGVDPASLSF